MAKWQARLVLSDGSELEIGADGEAAGLYLSGPRRVSAPERRVVMAQTADGDGDDPVSSQYGNRTIGYPLRCLCDTQAQFLALQAEVMVAIGKINRRRPAELVETPPGGATELTWDIVGADLGEIETASPFVPGFQDFDLALAAKPLARLPAFVLDPISSSEPLIEYDVSDVPGDHAALGALTLEDAATQIRRWIAWGVEAYHLDPALPLLYEAEALTLLASTVGHAGPAGAHGATANKVARQTALTTSYVEYVSTGALTHTGVFRVYVRAQAPSGNAGSVTVRLHWATGGQFSAYTPNAAVALPDDSAWHILDLGEITLLDPPIGDPSWEGRIAAKGSTGDDVDFDWIALLPVEECSGQVMGLDTPTSDPAIASGKQLAIQVAEASVQRTSTVWSDPGEDPGDPLLIPPGDSRLAIMQSRGKITAAEADSGSTDALDAALTVIPRTLYLPPT